MIYKIKESGEIYYYNKKKIIFIYNDKLKIFEEQPIDKIMNFIPTFLLPVLQSVGAKLYQQSPKSTKEEKKSHQEKIKQVSKMIENIKSTPYQKCILI
jgi:thymidylate synthase